MRGVAKRFGGLIDVHNFSFEMNSFEWFSVYSSLNASVNICDFVAAFLQAWN